jgi:undecaprenyl-diphosphatase
MSYLQTVVTAVVQGVTELFPVSSLGHSVLVPAWIGGSWETLVTQSSQATSETSFYLAYIVALHCATAVALLWFFRIDWVRIIRGFFRTVMPTLRRRRLVARDADERLAWLIVIATIPVGITGLALEHIFRTIFAKPLAASIFLFINGLILLAGERLRRTSAADDETAAAIRDARTRSDGGGGGDAAVAVASGPRTATELAEARASDLRISRLDWTDGVIVGGFQILALLAGISRSGVSMVGGLVRGLSHEDAARFAFLLATPVILAAGVLKLPTLAGSAGDHIHGQVAVGVLITGITAYLSVRFLVKYFETRTLTPFAIYCLITGAISAVHFA